MEVSSANSTQVTKLKAKLLMPSGQGKGFRSGMLIRVVMLALVVSISLGDDPDGTSEAEERGFVDIVRDILFEPTPTAAPKEPDVPPSPPPTNKSHDEDYDDENKGSLYLSLQVHTAKTGLRQEVASATPPSRNPSRNLTRAA